LLSLWPSACSSSSSSSSETGPTSTPEAIASADCERIAACLPVSLQIVYGDEATCRTRQTLTAASSAALAGAPDVRACAEALRAMSCEAYVNQHGAPPACRFTGAVGNGSACGSDWQCVSSFCPLVDTCGTCADAPGAGEPCALGRCAPGLACSSERCVAPGKTGAPCAGADDCEQTLSCVSGACVARAPLGAACGIDQPECATDLYCGGGNVCKVPKLAALGEACGAISGELVFCKGGYCKGGPMGTCAPFTADGQACGTGVDTCQPPASCVDGTCKVPDPAACH
jgi:hypothetical protein